ncbi:MAG: DUF262 domain-containing protein, partial [Chloroflexi bacterium]|nr:DUF262 domain-containing protein [Chloroflexota bacterium]
VVPYFQRAYSWGLSQWRVLYDDILELHELDSTHDHFLGSMVLLNEAGGSDHTLVIDGQQRLVTLSLFLAAIRDTARQHQPALAERLSQALTAAGEEPKVLPTYVDRDAFARVIARGGDEEDELPPSGIADAYRYFEAQLKAQPAGFDLERLERILMGQLSFVAIGLDSEDNPYRIFESLNAKGMPLTQGDLLRNYFFMRLPTAEHEDLYTKLWNPMQLRLGPRFDDFMRDFLVKEGEPVKADEVYNGWRRRLGPMSHAQIRDVLEELSEWSIEYDQLLHPNREPNQAARNRLDRLMRWSDTVGRKLHPFLLRIYGDYRRHKLSAEDLQEALLAAESYLVRRLFLNPPAVDENLLFMDLYRHAGSSGTPFAAALAKPQFNWPNDVEFRDAAVRYPLYFGSHPDQRLLIVRSIEDTFQHRFTPQYERFELDFLAPLLPRPEWLAELGVDEDGYWRVVSTLGNMTWALKGKYPSLRVEQRKKELALARQGVELPKTFPGGERWAAADIQDRSRRLADIAITIWPGPRR